MFEFLKRRSRFDKIDISVLEENSLKDALENAKHK
jgi:hypothetical protein